MAKHYLPAEFRAATGLSARTLHDWTRRKLLPKPLGRGRGARYDDRHLAAAHAVKHLRERSVPMSIIRTRIAGLSPPELLALVAQEGATADARSAEVGSGPARPTSTSYPAQTLEVVELMDGLSLLVNVERGGLVRRVAEDIYRNYALRRG